MNRKMSLGAVMALAVVLMKAALATEVITLDSTIQLIELDLHGPTETDTAAVDDVTVRKVFKETVSSDDEVPEDGDDIDDTGADSELRELRSKTNEKSGKVAERKKELSDLVAENKAEDSRGDATAKLHGDAKNNKTPGWSGKKFPMDSPASKSQIAADQEQKITDEKAAEKNLLTTQEDKDREATNSGVHSNAEDLAKEKAEEVIDQAQAKADQLKKEGKEEKLKADIDAKTTKAKAKVEAQEVEDEANKDRQNAQAEAKELVSVTKAETATMAAEANMSKSNTNTTNANMSNPLDNMDAPDFTKGLGKEPSEEQVKRVSQRLTKEKAEIDKMPPGDKQAEALEQWKAEKAKADVMKASGGKMSEADARAQSKANLDNINKADENPDAAPSTPDVPDVPDVVPGKQVPVPMNLKEQAANVAQSMITETALDDPKSLAAKLVDGIAKTKTKMVDADAESSASAVKNTDMKNANVDKVGFLSNKPTMPGGTSIAGVEMPPGMSP